MQVGQTDLVVFAEDPGAANWLAPVAKLMSEQEFSVTMIAEGAACDYLASRAVEFSPYPSDRPLTGWLTETGARAVLIGTAENSKTHAFDLVVAARKLALPSFAVVDQPVNADHRFRGLTGDPLSYVPDTVFVASGNVADKFVSLGLDRSHLKIVGNPHHDTVRERGQSLRGEADQLRSILFPEFDTDRPIIVFLAELGYMVNPEAKTWESEFELVGRGSSTYRTMVVLEELLDTARLLHPQPQIVVRLHPKNLQSEFDGVASEISAFSSGGDPLAVCATADLVVGMTTSLLEEAMFIGCRTLSVIPRAIEATWLPSIEDGSIPSVTNRSNLRHILPAVLAAPRPLAEMSAGASAAHAMATEIRNALKRTEA